MTKGTNPVVIAGRDASSPASRLRLLHKEMMMRVMVVLSICLLTTGCMTMSGNYRLTVTDAQGNDATGGRTYLAGGGAPLYSMRNGLCLANTGGTVRGVDAAIGVDGTRASPDRGPTRK